MVSVWVFLILDWLISIKVVVKFECVEGEIPSVLGGGVLFVCIKG